MCAPELHEASCTASAHLIPCFTTGREKPKVCSNKLITCYIILAVCLVLSILAVVVLVTTPSASQYTQIINQGLPDVLLMSIVSIVPSPAWLVKADLTFEKDCFGEYCHIPCDKLSPTHISEYELIEKDYIYCLNNTVFNFTLNQTEFVSGNMAVWLIEGNPTTYPNPTGNCSTNPTIQGKQVCIELNFTHPSGTIEVWHEGIEGAYYYWRAWPIESIDSIDAVIQDWYVYNITSCESSDSFSGVNSPIIMSYHEGFQPTNFTSPCLLVSINQTSNCEGIDIETHRRYDIVFWPGLAGILVIVTIAVTGIIHAVYYFNLKNKYNQLQERVN